MHMRGLLHLVSQAAVITAADLTAVALVVASFPHKVKSALGTRHSSALVSRAS
jgi:hypothetical protein